MSGLQEAYNGQYGFQDVSPKTLSASLSPSATLCHSQIYRCSNCQQQTVSPTTQELNRLPSIQSLLQTTSGEAPPPAPSPRLPSIQSSRNIQPPPAAIQPPSTTAPTSIFKSGYSLNPGSSSTDRPTATGHFSQEYRPDDRPRGEDGADRRYTAQTERTQPYTSGPSSTYAAPSPSQYPAPGTQQQLPMMQPRPSATTLPQPPPPSFSSAPPAPGATTQSFSDPRYYTSDRPGESRRPSYNNYEPAPRHDSRIPQQDGWDSSRGFQYGQGYDYIQGPNFTFHSIPMNDQSYQRKRRGNLPKEATGVLKDWFNTHRESPYPSEEEKQNLCDRTGLTLNQVSNWFINARRRNPGREAARNRNATNVSDSGIPPRSLPHERR